MDIQWEQPPREVLEQQGRHPGRYLDFALELRNHPGRWAVLPGPERTKGSASGAAQNVRRGQTKGFTRGEYEALAHGTKVWVRYVGAIGSEARRITAEVDGKPEPEEDSQTEAATEEESPATVSRGVQPVPTTPAAKVRAWAKSQGIEVPERGRLPEGVWEKYAAALQAGERGLGLRAIQGGDGA